MRFVRNTVLAAAMSALTITAVPATAASLTGKWSGTYECDNKTYQLGLRLVQEKRTVYGILRFIAPDGTTGIFRVEGWHSLIGEIRLNPGEWVEQPPGFTAITLYGETQGKNRIIGAIDSAACGGFHANRE